MQPGVYHDITAKEYHALTDIVSNSYLGKLAKVPACAKLPQEETVAMRFGRAFHSYVLEGLAALSDDFAIVDSLPTKPNKRSTQKTIDAYTEWQESLNGKQAISLEDFTAVQQMRNAVMNHPFASHLLDDGISETTIIWRDEETGLLCKVRPDRIPSGNKGVIWDLKSTSNASRNAFLNDCIKYGYAREGAMYLEGFSRAMGALYDDLIFALVAVEKEDPFRVEVYTIEVDLLEYGYGEFHRLLQIEKVCRDNNFWPHYQNPGSGSLFKPGYLQTWEYDTLENMEKKIMKGKTNGNTK
jgi:hypothetical protein